MCQLLSEGGRCNNCGRRAAEARFTSAEACSSRAIANVQTVAANGAAPAAPEATDDNGGSSLYLDDNGGSALYLEAPKEKPADAPVLKPGAKRKRLREILDTLRRAAAKRSDARRALALESAEAEHAAELDAACDRVDRREAALELELVAAATVDHSIGGEKQLLDLEAEACERERNEAVRELFAIRAAWSPRDDKTVNGRHTKAFERRAYLEGRPAMIAAEHLPAGGGSAAADIGVGEARASRSDAAHRRLQKLQGTWTATAEKKYQKRLTDIEREGVKERREYLDAHPAHYQWADPNAPVIADDGSRGHLGMLETRAATARRIAAARPSAADRASQISEARFEVTLAKHELAALQERHADRDPS
ncbi:MAG: hypothetical protein HHJ14_02355 [Cellulomonas sp.]|nr:hypothetical protein [Cellulomonas sp.]